ncbi:MAG: zinc metallopeptidase [Planctomycetes bacterium]|nr:zinc metallopeptidase [Planctomycetota bacterium]
MPTLGFLYFDPHYLLLVALPTMAICLIAQLWVKSAYAKWTGVANKEGITGREAAYVILRKAGIEDVTIEESDGFLSDHYSPREKVLRLSPENFRGRSIAAVGVAAHEAGHAIQHAQSYPLLALRNLAVPMASIGSMFGYVAISIGVFMAYNGAQPLNAFSLIGLVLIGAIAAFQIVNLPVEFDASRRALKLLPSIGILSEEENAGARQVLTAAAMTYVAATIAAIWTLIYWMLRLGLIGGRRDD